MNTPDKPLTAAQAESLTAASEPWLSCDDCFEQIDNYVDALLGGQCGLEEPLRVHLARCPACYDEAESLISLAADDQGKSPEDLLSAFHIDLGLSADEHKERPGIIARLLRRNRTADPG